MSKSQKKMVWLLLPLCAIFALILWRGEIQNLWQSFSPAESPPAPVAEKLAPAEDLAEAVTALPSPSLLEREVLEEDSARPGIQPPPEMEVADSPPLPRIDPASSQEERFRAFHMRESIDHIVRKEEPFEIGGKTWRLDDILGKLADGDQMRELIPFIQEKPIGPSIRRPIQESLAPHLRPDRYYGVRVVRPSENIWTIHYGIFREYMKRRGIEIAPAADRPLADGRSSGVGRLLKFMEHIVLVYNTETNRMVQDLHMIHPSIVIIFFNISDLFAAFDQLNSNTLLSLRYVESGLVIDKPDERIPLLERRGFRH